MDLRFPLLFELSWLELTEVFLKTRKKKSIYKIFSQKIENIFMSHTNGKEMGFYLLSSSHFSGNILLEIFSSFVKKNMNLKISTCQRGLKKKYIVF